LIGLVAFRGIANSNQILDKPQFIKAQPIRLLDDIGNNFL